VRVVRAIDLESNMWDMVISQGGKKVESMFMCMTPNRVNHIIRQSATIT